MANLRMWWCLSSSGDPDMEPGVVLPYLFPEVPAANHTRVVRDLTVTRARPR